MRALGRQAMRRRGMTIPRESSLAARVLNRGPAVGAVSFLAGPCGSAQQSAKISRIGIISTTSLEHPQARAGLDQFTRALEELGYIEGRNLVIENRSAEGSVERYPA